ncbi:hypothetical protein LSCM1_04863 [Leishmania martiniquensis]|uniref:Zinc finger LSD1-type domain-containing protein n=1 Tax=Leishmania martiniquensis TaxID=1580590 RepID=A0A836HL26_9TRYP|nr:hypothetical protein LSCM1_04863 [Leishmania martiniquensis]
MLFGQVVCYGCHRIITYPLGAITCRCRLCNTVNSAQNLQISCGTCGQMLHAPINTLTLLCPCCGTITDIPEELLPPLPSCTSLGGGPEEAETVMYVSHPTLPPQSPSNGEANVTAACPAGPQRLSAPPKDNGHLPSASSLQGRLSGRDEAASVVQGGREETVVDCEANDACEEAGTRSERVNPVASGEEMYVAAAGRETHRAAPSRLAPTVMIATRIL